jgi:choline dehydrogenase-like flavoprotein
MRNPDVVIVGSGAGGATLGYALARKGLKVLVLERGTTIPSEDDNWTEAGAFGDKYDIDRLGCVGGKTKVYGAALYRMRECDFDQVEYPDGSSPAWPITYQDLEPYYDQAEAIYKVHGSPVGDPTEPAGRAPYPYPELPHEPYVQEIVTRMSDAGVQVARLPRAIDLGPDGSCIFCTTCDGYACKVDAKLDAEIACLRPAARTGNFELLENASCEGLAVDPSGGRVVEIRFRHDGKDEVVSAGVFVLAAGWLGSASILWHSKSTTHPRGLGNSSGLLGKGIVGHNAQYMLGLSRGRIPELHQKTFAINEYYSGTEEYPFPMGVIQPPGQIPIWKKVHPLASGIVRQVWTRSFPLFYMNELLPDDANRLVFGDDGTQTMRCKANNMTSFRGLRRLTKRVMKSAGFPLTIAPRRPLPGPWHPGGTVRFGADPATSVLDPYCRAHDLENLFVVDSSFLPSAGALNTSLTVMAQALRVADHIPSRL